MDPDASLSPKRTDIFQLSSRPSLFDRVSTHHPFKVSYSPLQLNFLLQSIPKLLWAGGWQDNGLRAQARTEGRWTPPRGGRSGAPTPISALSERHGAVSEMKDRGTRDRDTHEYHWIVGFQIDWRQCHLLTGERGPDWALDSPVPPPPTSAGRPAVYRCSQSPDCWQPSFPSSSQEHHPFSDSSTETLLKESSSPLIRRNCRLLWEAPWWWRAMR